MWKLLIIHKYINSKNQQMIHKGHLEKQVLLIRTNLLHIMSGYINLCFMKTKIFTEWILLTFFFLSSLFHLHLCLDSFFFLSLLCWITTGFYKCYSKIIVNTDYWYLLCNFVLQALIRLKYHCIYLSTINGKPLKM